MHEGNMHHIKTTVLTLTLALSGITAAQAAPTLPPSFQGVWATDTATCTRKVSNMSEGDFRLTLKGSLIVMEGWAFKRVEKIYDVHQSTPSKFVYDSEYSEQWDKTRSDGVEDASVLSLRNGILTVGEAGLRVEKCRQ